MGLTEETGQTIRAAIAALGTVPGLLVVVLLNLATMTGAAWVWHKQDQMKNETLRDLVARCLPLDRGPRP